MSVEVLNPLSPTIVEGITPWEPERALVNTENIAAFATTLPNLSRLSLGINPSTLDLYAIGDDYIAYGMVSLDRITSRTNNLLKLVSRGTQMPDMAFSPKGRKLPIDYRAAQEESKVRLVHTALGVASLRMAAHAGTAEAFDAICEDAIAIFNMPYHSTARINEINVPDSGHTLLYGFKRAANIFRTLDKARAYELFEGLQKTVQDGASWYEGGGQALEFSVGYDDKRLKEPSDDMRRTTQAARVIARMIVEFSPGPDRILLYDPNMGDVRSSPFARYAEVLGITSDDSAPEEQFQQLYAHYITEEEPFPALPPNKLQAALMRGVHAYVHARRGNILATMIDDNLRTTGTQDLSPLITTGTILAEMMNRNPDVPAEFKRSLQGVGNESALFCFEAIRDAISLADKAKPEKGIIAHLGAFVREHIKQSLATLKER
jgi:hypothetical protein